MQPYNWFVDLQFRYMSTFVFELLVLIFVVEHPFRSLVLFVGMTASFGRCFGRCFRCCFGR